ARRVLCNHYRRQDVERAYLEALASLPEREVPSEETPAIVLETLVELDRLLDQGLQDDGAGLFAGDFPLG
ncbi:hypothetical protein ACV34F_30050, partial [Pseudomonas aeruginosa]